MTHPINFLRYIISMRNFKVGASMAINCLNNNNNLFFLHHPFLVLEIIKSAKESRHRLKSQNHQYRYPAQKFYSRFSIKAMFIDVFNSTV